MYEQNEHVQYIVDRLCNKDGDKPYVFISYRSKDREVVLHDIVYTLVKKYHLNVYFDGDFDGHNPLWTEQFPANMGSPLCRGVLAFVDKEYMTSYATLMELLYSQAGCTNEDHEVAPKTIIPINLEKPQKINDETDTGLGKKVYEDNTINIHYAEELQLFNETFDVACEDEMHIFKAITKKNYKEKSRHPNGPLLPKWLCSEMMSQLLAYNGANDNYYQGTDALDGIVRSIKDACGQEVFLSSEDTEVIEPDHTGGGFISDPILQNKKGISEIMSLKEFREYMSDKAHNKEIINKWEQMKSQRITGPGYVMMASLLGGPGKSKPYRLNFVENVAKLFSNGKPNSGTWSSMVASTVNGAGERRLGVAEEYKTIPESITIGEIRKRFEGKEKDAYRLKGGSDEDLQKCFDILLGNN